MIRCCVIFSCIADSVSWLRPQSLAKTAIVYLTESPFLIFRLATLLGGTVISTSRITSSFKLAIALDYENENGCATVILPVYFFATVFLNKQSGLKAILPIQNLVFVFSFFLSEAHSLDGLLVAWDLFAVWHLRRSFRGVGPEGTLGELEFFFYFPTWLLLSSSDALFQFFYLFEMQITMDTFYSIVTGSVPCNQFRFESAPI